MKKEILRTIRYFSFFNYPPTAEEIYTFLSKKCSKEKLKKELEYLVKKKKLLTFNFKLLNSSRYTLEGYGIAKSKIKNQKSKIRKNHLSTRQFNNYINRQKISQKKLNNWRFRLYIKLLSFFPQIKLVGLSGSMAMMNAKEEDDIDLFIITAKNRLWTGRFLALILAQIIGIRRKFTKLKRPRQIGKLKIKDKVCLNLFFGEDYLQVPDFKKTEYVAHEILQMKPLINKNQTYEKFLWENRWVFKIFPNSSLKFKIKNSKLQFKIQNFKFLTEIFNFSFLIFNLMADGVEKILKGLQLYFIQKHKTSEVILDTQLWFHPDDFNNKIKKVI